MLSYSILNKHSSTTKNRSIWRIPCSCTRRSDRSTSIVEDWWKIYVYLIVAVQEIGRAAQEDRARLRAGWGSDEMLYVICENGELSQFSSGKRTTNRSTCFKYMSATSTKNVSWWLCGGPLEMGLRCLRMRLEYGQRTYEDRTISFRHDAPPVRVEPVTGVLSGVMRNAYLPYAVRSVSTTNRDVWKSCWHCVQAMTVFLWSRVHGMTIPSRHHGEEKQRFGKNVVRAEYYGNASYKWTSVTCRASGVALRRSNRCGNM